MILTDAAIAETAIIFGLVALTIIVIGEWQARKGGQIDG